MAFRVPLDSRVPVAPVDPLARFLELLEAFESGRTLFEDRVSLRLAAIGLLTTPGAADVLAEHVRLIDAELKQHLGWFSSIHAPMRRLLAALLVRDADDPAHFIEDLEQARSELHGAGLRRSGAYETLAITVLRRVLRGRPIDTGVALRFKAIYEQMKLHHWWLTGPDDYPACAMLLARDESPEEIGGRVEAIYQALHRQAGLWRGDPLQTAANVLGMSELEPEEAADRFRMLHEAFAAAGQRVDQAEYDEVAVLCFLAQPAQRIAETTVEYRDALREAIGRFTLAGSAFTLAANMAFVRLLRPEELLGSLGDVKLLLDMQAIIAARQAAAATAAASA